MWERDDTIIVPPYHLFWWVFVSSWELQTFHIFHIEYGLCTLHSVFIKQCAVDIWFGVPCINTLWFWINERHCPSGLRTISFSLWFHSFVNSLVSSHIVSYRVVSFWSSVTALCIACFLVAINHDSKWTKWRFIPISSQLCIYNHELRSQRIEINNIIKSTKSNMAQKLDVKTTAHNTEKMMMTTAMTKKIKTNQKYYNK